MATIEQIAKCKEIFEIAMMVTAQGKESVHAAYTAHVDSFEVYKSSQPDGWDCTQRLIYLGLRPIALGAMDKLEIIKSELEAMLDRDADGVPV